MCFQAIQHAIFQFFESSEGKGVNDENDLVIYLGYKNYFDLISLTATLLVSGKRKVFEIEFHLKGSLDPKEIEVCKKEVCKMKVHPMKGMTYETAPSHIKKAWNKMKETVRKQRCGKTLSDIFGVKIAENSNIKRSQSLIKYHSNNGIATEKDTVSLAKKNFL